MISSSARNLFNRLRLFGFDNPLGDALQQKKGVLVAKYDFAKQGGAVGSIQLVPDLSNLGVKSKLPSGAVITNAYIDIITAIVSTGNNGTLALTAQSAGDLLAAVDGDTLSGRAQGIPDNVVANTIKLTAERTITAAIATNAFTAGKFNVFVEYVLSENT